MALFNERLAVGKRRRFFNFFLNAPLSLECRQPIANLNFVCRADAGSRDPDGRGPATPTPG